MEQFQFHTLGKVLLIVGGILVILGLVFLLAGRIPFFGKLPGDLSIKSKSFSIYIPIATCMILSVILTVILNLFLRR